MCLEVLVFPSAVLSGDGEDDDRIYMRKERKLDSGPWGLLIRCKEA
jgi:hypothetical protein